MIWAYYGCPMFAYGSRDIHIPFDDCQPGIYSRQLKTKNMAFTRSRSSDREYGVLESAVLQKSNRAKVEQKDSCLSEICLASRGKSIAFDCPVSSGPPALHVLCSQAVPPHAQVSSFVRQ